MLEYPKFCKCLQLYTVITQDDLAEGLPAAPALPAITSTPVPAAMLISHTPSPSLLQSGDMHTWIAVACCVPYRCWNSPWPASRFAAHAYKARNGVHLPACLHAPQQHSTSYDSNGSESDSTLGHSGQCWCCPTCKQLADLYKDIPFTPATSTICTLYILKVFEL